MALPTLLSPPMPKVFCPPSLPASFKLPSLQSLKFLRKLHSLSPSLQSSSFPIQNEESEDHAIGDCLVFEEDAFEDPYLRSSVDFVDDSDSINYKPKPRPRSKKKIVPEIETDNLVPDKWREAQAEINITKKERRKIAQELQFNSRVERKKNGLVPIKSANLEEYKTYREAKLAQLKSLVPDNTSSLTEKQEDDEEKVEMNETSSSSQRVMPKNPRWAVYGKGFDDVAEFFNSGNYAPGQKSDGPRKLFTKEERDLLNKRVPDVAAATSSKWIPLHTLAASGEFYLVEALLKHNVDINAVDVDGLTALHKAIICKKQAVTSYLLRESANPFVRDREGATLMHYAVQTASSPAIKLLLLYNVDINLQDNDGWTPLHLAVQARRTDIVKLLLIKGADKTIKNQDGLTPLDLCLYSGRDTGTYELIKLLKQLPKKRSLTRNPYNILVS